MSTPILDMKLDELGEAANGIEQLRDAIEPGDLLFFRNDGKLSRLISHFDGYWSHVGIAVDKHTIAHSTDPGGISDEITAESLTKKGPDGGALARVRIERSPNATELAAAWAKKNAPTRAEYAAAGKSADLKQYEGRDLGLAAALLWRSILRRQGWKELPSSSDLISQAVEVADRQAADYMPKGYTCSGFVFAAYAKGALQRLELDFPENILRISDTHVLGPADPGVQSLAARTLAADDLYDYAAMIADRDVLGLDLFEVQQAFRAFPKVFRALRNNKPLQIDQVVSPGSLWRSEQVKPVMFINRPSLDRAHEETAKARA